MVVDAQVVPDDLAAGKGTTRHFPPKVLELCALNISTQDFDERLI